MNGKGIWTNPRGSTDEGVFRNGKMEGIGRRLYKDGSRYEGEFKDDEPNGMGVLTTAKGNEFEGHFKNGRFVERGTLPRPIQGGTSRFVLAIVLLVIVAIPVVVVLAMSRRSRNRGPTETGAYPFPGEAQEDQDAAALLSQADIDSFKRILVLDTESQAEALDALLTARRIPHVMKSYHDSALDGLYQGTRGWGHVEAPPERAEEIRQAFQDLASARADQEFGPG